MLSGILETSLAHIQTTVFEGGSILIDVKRQVCYRLDRLGTLVWLRICEGRSIPEISSEVTGMLGDAAAADRCVQSLIGELGLDSSGLGLSSVPAERVG
jgi:hypothetical protein